MRQKYEYDIGIFAMQEKENIAKNLLGKMLEYDGYRVKTVIFPEQAVSEEVSARFYSLAKNECDFLIILTSDGFEKNILAQQTVQIGLQKSNHTRQCKIVLVESRDIPLKQKNKEVYTIDAKEYTSAAIALEVNGLIKGAAHKGQEREVMPMQVVIADKIEHSKFF